jgi:ParB family chromosome partitioning protein
MTTILKSRSTENKKTSVSRNKSTNKPNAAPRKNNLSDAGIPQQMALSEIDICPRNYRLIFAQKEIEEFANELKRHGIISSLLVRPMPGGRHELVVGERRYRAAQIAKIDILPVQVRNLTDQEAKEIRLAENIHRENVHPLHEAFAIKDMLEIYPKIEEVAKRMGKSKGWVYSRLKISELIEPLQEMFQNDKLSIIQAETIASLAPSSQSEFFMDCCEDWADENFELDEVDWRVERLKRNLKNAPFDLTDKDLFPDVGACTNCPFNSATLNYLFPELGKEATCSNGDCYSQKCYRQKSIALTGAFEKYTPDAILYVAFLGQEDMRVIEAHPIMSGLPRYNRYSVTFIDVPAAPAKSDYEEIDGDEIIAFDEISFNLDQQEYEQDLELYHAKVMGGEILRGLLVHNKEYKLRLFELLKDGETSSSISTQKVTAKEVQQAIKQGTVTIELLTAEISRLNDRESRQKELDLEKIQEQIYDGFKEGLTREHYSPSLNNTDIIAAGLLIFQSLDWNIRNTVIKTLFPETAIHDNEEFYRALSNFTDAQYAHLIRLAICGRSTSSMPLHMDGFMLYRIAKDTGFDVATIERQQQEKATEREKKVKQRIEELENKIEKLKSVA